ncbi:hypothetical protein NDU88_003591 [Pleurodeles waltl]|uniref:Uncharacterized protein n=1 Tax=Pleurodeles waltl TaxID=8319 RepID=A0AAV7KYW8_PLEWA|nr:hypothetical protein NDU88_003591 [Pleurodeles waltl]
MLPGSQPALRYFNPEDQPQQSRLTTSDNAAAATNEAATHTPNRRRPAREIGTRGTVTGMDEKDDAPLGHAKAESKVSLNGE